jgi:hypothetical protein
LSPTAKCGSALAHPFDRQRVGEGGFNVSRRKENPVPTALVVIAPQELGHFEFDGFLEHELSVQADAFRQWRLPGGGADELFFERLAGELPFHDVFRFLFYRRSWSLHTVGFCRKLRTSRTPALR